MVARLLLVLVVLVAWNLSAAYAQRPWMPLLRHWVPVVDGLPARRALHRGIGFLYVLTATLGYWYLVPSVVVPYVLALYVLLVVSLRAALFEPVLQNGEPGYVWGRIGNTAAYDLFRRWLAARFEWPVEWVGALSNVLAAGLALVSLGGLWWLLV